MLARLQQAITLTALAFAIASIAYGLRSGHVALATMAVLLVCCAHAVVIAVEFALHSAANRNDGAPASTLRQQTAAWYGEVLQAPTVFCWRQPFQSQRWPDYLPTSTNPRCGVVLVHGFFCNRGIWNRWMPRLRSLGVPYIAVNLEPVFGSIGEYTAAIEAAVSRLEATTGMAPVIVAHSMGGLAARAWWSGVEQARARRLVTIGTPHRGTWLARWALSHNARQMQINSPWRSALEARESPTLAQRVTCFYGHCDNIVFPASNATLRGADNRHLPAVAHVHMLDHPEPFAEALRWLQLEQRLPGPEKTSIQ